MKYATYIGRHKETWASGCGVFRQGEKTEVNDEQFQILSKLSQFRVQDDSIIESVKEEVSSPKKKSRKKINLMEDTTNGGV